MKNLLKILVIVCLVFPNFGYARKGTNLVNTTTYTMYARPRDTVISVLSSKDNPVEIFMPDLAEIPIGTVYTIIDSSCSDNKNNITANITQIDGYIVDGNKKYTVFTFSEKCGILRLMAVSKKVWKVM